MRPDIKYLSTAQLISAHEITAENVFAPYALHEVRQELINRLDRTASPQLAHPISISDAKAWVQRLRESKARSIGQLQRLKDMEGYPTHSSISRQNYARDMRAKNRESCEVFLSRIDSMIAFIAQFAGDSPGKILYERRNIGMRFEGLSIELKQVWEELATHVDE